MRLHIPLILLLIVSLFLNQLAAEDQRRPYNVLLIISDDLTATALSSSGEQVRPHALEDVSPHSDRGEEVIKVIMAKRP